ncbi:CobW family GTP-binding protein [Streptomyces luteolus]|uniref:GTP-binding protein n=1 Tax=Streptomyces luteolus TaxID=3043615 RepID=A0ABT6ST51_9ACTN|nr:GTP-binding protein [Streptomyces sp. B-S-A12]MDI3418784.1 GTP-binding protein [Streptomyces sp. B-S-A12]
MSKRQIPVVVLAGFLGSGKTTLLNQLLKHSGGNRIGVVVNDFGAIEIDAMSVAGQVGSTVSLGNGCLCCAVDGSELDAYLEKLTRPSVGLDVIVIEASGLAEPQELVRMLLASDNPNIVYGGLVEVVDAAEFDATRERHPEIERHLALADLVVLNKTDRVDVGALPGLRASVEGFADGAAVVESTYGRIDPELLFDGKPKGERFGQLSFDDLPEGDLPDGDLPDELSDDLTDELTGDLPGDDAPDEGGLRGEHRHVHLHAAYDSVSFASGVALHPRRLLDFLDGRPEGLYRIKGFVDFGPYDPRNRYTLHAVGRVLRFYPEPWPRDAEHGTQLVLIGSGVDGPALRTALEHCRDDQPQDAGLEEVMWGILRYVDEREPEPEPQAESLEPESAD